MTKLLSCTVLCLLLCAAAKPQSAAAPAHISASPDQPQLETRGTVPENPPVPLDARITAPVTIPTEAWGHFTFGRDLDLLEVDLESRGLTGYITILGDKGIARGQDKVADKNAPLTFFFSKSRVGGDSVYFLTQQIHRVSYEFSGTMQQMAPRDRTLEVDYSLVGTLTLHHAQENGTDKKESRTVDFKRMNVHMR